MANEGATNEGGNPNPNPNPGGGTGEPNPNANPNPNPDPKPGSQPGNKDGWDKERAGLIAETQKERTARRKLEQAQQTLQTQLDEAMKRVQALAGVGPKDANADEDKEIRDRLMKVAPELGELLDGGATLKQIKELLSMLPALKRTTEHYWGRHGTNVLHQIEAKIGEEFGDKLTDAQIKKIRAAYVIEAETNPEFAKLHEDDPEKAVTDFAKDWIDSWVEPAKRRAQAEEIARRPKVPSGKDRNLVTGSGEKPIDVNDPKAVEDTLVAGFRNKGGRFARE